MAQSDSELSSDVKPLPVLTEGLLFTFLAGLGYWIAAHIGLAFIPAGGGVTPVWPPNGLIFGLLLVTQKRRWPWILAGVAAACMGANLTAARSLEVTLGFTTANLLEILAGAWVFRYFHSDTARFATRREVGLLALVAVPVFATTALFGAAVGALLLDGSLATEWQKWWLGDAVGTLLIAPAVVITVAARRAQHTVRTKRLVQAAILFSGHGGLCWLAFLYAPFKIEGSLLDTAVFPYITMGTLLLIALRLGPSGSILACLISTAFALMSQFPMIGGELIADDDVRTIVSNQIFLAVSALLGLYFATQGEENRLARRALAASEERFRSLATGAPVGIFVTGALGEVTFINDAACKIIGMEASSITPDGGLRQCHPDDRERVSKLWYTCFTERSEFNAEYRFLRPDGSITWCVGLASPQYDSDAQFLGFVGTLTDITASKAAELRVRESEGRFRDIADATPTMIWTTSPEGLLEYVNSTWLQFHGTRPADDLGKPVWNHFAESKTPANWQDAVAQGVPFSHECAMRRVDGETRAVLVKAAPRRAANGEYLGHVGVCLDITPLRAAEEARIAVSARLQESARAESIMDLARGVAHEFNNILTVVLGNSNLAQLESGLSETLRDRLCNIEEGALRAADLTRKLLAYSGRSNGYKSLQVLSNIVVDTLPLLKASLPKLAQVHVNAPLDLPGSVLDAVEVQQVFANLFTNAIEALPEGRGNIRVATGSRIFDTNRLKELLSDDDALPGNYVYLQVTDDGCGIAPENLPRLFEPFFSTKFIGRGLGLAAAQGIMREHGGFLHVTSTPGQGSTFVAYFPSSGRSVEIRSASDTTRLINS